MPPQRMKSPIDDPSWLPRHRDALMLANLLRVSRLTLLHGEAGAGKSALLKNELLALLRRRATDLAPQAASPTRVVVPLPDRRNGERLAAHGEVAVFFDTWDAEDPLAGLLARIEAELGIAPDPTPSHAPRHPVSLADTLLRLGQRHATRLLIILDGFEAHLAADPEDAGARRFADALAQVLNHPGVPAHFFIVVRDEAQPLLDPWRARVPGFGDRWLRIRHWSSLLPRPGDRDEGAPAGSASERPRPPTLVRTTSAAEPVHAVDKTPPPESHPGLELGIDLYLPLPPQQSRPPSERVQALWDQLLSRPIAHRPPASAASAAPAIPVPVAAVAPPPDTLPAPQPDAETLREAIAVELPMPRRTPWMAWSLAVIVVAAVMIYAWGDSLQDKPPAAQQAPIAAGVEPAREP
jgi:hypothetical protein